MPKSIAMYTKKVHQARHACLACSDTVGFIEAFGRMSNAALVQNQIDLANSIGRQYWQVSLNKIQLAENVYSEIRADLILAIHQKESPVDQEGTTYESWHEAAIQFQKRLLARTWADASAAQRSGRAVLLPEWAMIWSDDRILKPSELGLITSKDGNKHWFEILYFCWQKEIERPLFSRNFLRVKTEQESFLLLESKAKLKCEKQNEMRSPKSATQTKKKRRTHKTKIRKPQVFYNEVEFTLIVGKRRVKICENRGATQLERVLIAFQSQGWPSHIKDPFSLISKNKHTAMRTRNQVLYNLRKKTQIAGLDFRSKTIDGEPYIEFALEPVNRR